jgi:hypothetical protein
MTIYIKVFKDVVYRAKKILLRVNNRINVY